MLTLNDGRSELWQWDTGRTLAVDADCSQVHFSNKVFGRSIDVDVADGTAIIPDILLQTDKDLNVWAFVGAAENGYTKISKTFKVNRRNKPADYVFTPQEQITLKDATAILEEAKDVANDAMETAKKAEASADKASQIADEMKRLADQVEQNTETATKAKADALTAQAKAEEARNAAETAKKAAEEAASSAGTDASAASSAATRAQNASNDAAAALDSIQVLYQEMQTWAHGVIQGVDAAGNAAVQSVQSAGDAQVQRVTDEGATQTANAKAQADAAAQSAAYASQSAQQAEESAAVYDDVVADVTQLKQDVAAITPDDTAVDGKPWTSKKIVDSLCQPFEESGNPVQVYPVENYPLGVKVSWEPVQEGSGDPSPDNIRPITGRDAVSVERCGTKNLLDMSKCVAAKPDQAYGLTITIDGDTIHISGVPNVRKDVPYAMFRVFRIDQNALLANKNNLKRTTFDANDEIKYTSIGSDRYFVIQTPLYAGQEKDCTFRVMMSYDTPTAYEPYTGSTNTLTLPETVYGGEVDAVSGEGQETWKTLTLDGTEIWYKYGNVSEKSGASCFTFSIDDKDIGFGTSVCNKFVNTKNSDPFFNVNMKKFTYTDHPGLKNIYMNYGDDQTVSLDEWKSYLAAQYAAGTPIQIAYKLAEPVPFTATGEQPIPALSGVNTIYTDADGVVVTGAEDPKHTITELKNAIISLGGNI